MTPLRSVLLATLLLVGLPGAAHAHAQLLRSVPPARAVVSQAPARVELRFSDEVELAFSTFAVVDGAGTRVDLDDAARHPDDPHLVSLGLEPLSPGTYRVRYRVLSADGHVVDGEYRFTVKPAP